MDAVLMVILAIVIAAKVVYISVLKLRLKLAV